MAIKQNYALTRAEFDEALVRLRLNVSEVAKETSIPRSYCSEFRNGDRQLRPEQLAKLKDYFESKGLVFENDEPAAEQQPIAEPIYDLNNPDTEGFKRTLLAVKHLAIDPKISDHEAKSIIAKVKANDREIELFLKEKAERGFIDDWSELTDTYLRQVFGLLSENYLLECKLKGRPLVVLEDSNDADSDSFEIVTIADVLVYLLRKQNSTLVTTEQINGDFIEVEGEKS